MRNSSRRNVPLFIYAGRLAVWLRSAPSPSLSLCIVTEGEGGRRFLSARLLSLSLLVARHLCERSPSGLFIQRLECETSIVTPWEPDATDPRPLPALPCVWAIVCVCVYARV